MKEELKTNPTDDIKIKLEDKEQKIANETEQQFSDQVKQSLGFLTGDDGGINTNGVWSAEKQNNSKRQK